MYVFLAIGAAPALSIAAATSSVVPVLPTSPTVPAAALSNGPVPVQLQITVNLSALHPAASQGALVCGAVAQTRDWANKQSASLVNYDSVYRLVLGPAHYMGNQATLEFPIADRSYNGTLTYSTTLSPQALIDPTTHGRFAPKPAVLMACWLSINGRPAVADSGPGLQVVSVSNFNSVTGKPLAIAVTDAGAPIGGPLQLSAQGNSFAPGSVNVAASVGTVNDLAQTLAKELAGVGVPMSSNDVNQLIHAILVGGQSAMSIAQYITDLISGANNGLSQQQLNTLSNVLSQRSSASLQISQILRAKLNQIRVSTK